MSFFDGDGHQLSKAVRDMPRFIPFPNYGIYKKYFSHRIFSSLLIHISCAMPLVLSRTAKRAIPSLDERQPSEPLVGGLNRQT